MRTIKDKLTEYSDEMSEWVKVNSRRVTQTEKKVNYSERGQFVQIDIELFDKMFCSVSKASERVAKRMMRDMNYQTNISSGTYEEIMDDLELSKGTVIRVMSELRSIDFIRKYKNGRYMINPAVAIKCSFDFFPKLQTRYMSLQPYIENNEKELSIDVD